MDHTAQGTMVEVLVGYFGDQSVQDGVAEMVRVTAFSPAYHERYTGALRTGLEAARAGDPEVLAVVKREYAPLFRGMDEVTSLLRDILAEYQVQYDRATR